MSFQQGLSGLNSSSKALDVVSNNIANANTVGFKSSAAHFADVYANSLAGAGASQVGIGTQTAAIQQSFTQGNVTTTNNPLDLAINGGGFYRMSTNGSLSYSRNGQFHLDKDGYIIDDRSRRLTGNQAADGVLTGAMGDLKLSSAMINPSLTKNITLGLNLNSRAINPLAQTPPGVPFPAGPLLPVGTVPPVDSYNSSTSQTIYDSLGNAHVQSYYFVKEAAPATNTWDVYSMVDKGVNDGGTVANVATLRFSETGALTPPDPLNPLNPRASTINPQTMRWDATLGVAAQTLTFDFSQTTQYGSSFATNALGQDGFTTGRLAGLAVSADGTISGNYSNGQSRILGQVVLANFTNPNGLTSLGGNQWGETATSGPAIVGTPNTGTLGVLQAAAVEESNTDLTAELVNMITQQRNYQANAQSIKTQDSIMQTLVNLR